MGPENGFEISQESLINKIISQFGLEDCKPSVIPMEPRLQLHYYTLNTPDLPYKELIGSLMYLMLGSRPDLCFAITYFSQFKNSFNENHWSHLKKVVCYLKHTKHLRLHFGKSTSSEFNISAFVDADFANDIKDRSSISGYVIKLNGNSVCWRSKKQSNVALSSAEAEYYAVSDCLTEVLFLKQIIFYIVGDQLHKEVSVYEDNQACIKMARTLENKRTKHVDVRHHFVKQLVQDGFVKLEYVASDQQLADLITKALPVKSFTSH